jgi:hypothetical protein
VALALARSIRTSPVVSIVNVPKVSLPRSSTSPPGVMVKLPAFTVTSPRTCRYPAPEIVTSREPKSSTQPLETWNSRVMVHRPAAGQPGSTATDAASRRQETRTGRAVVVRRTGLPRVRADARAHIPDRRQAARENRAFHGPGACSGHPVGSGGRSSARDAHIEGLQDEVKWGSNGNPFFDLLAVAVDPSDGTVVVAENPNGNGIVHRFTPTGTLINSWNAVVATPVHDSLAVDGAGNVSFGATDNTVRVFTSTGSPVTQWGGTGSGDGQFDVLRGLARSSGGDVFVSNGSGSFSGLPRVQRFTSTGGFVAKWGSLGTGFGQFSWNSPSPALAVDAGNNVFVADGGNSRVQKFACQ